MQPGAAQGRVCAWAQCLAHSGHCAWAQRLAHSGHSWIGWQQNEQMDGWKIPPGMHSFKMSSTTTSEIIAWVGKGYLSRWPQRPRGGHSCALTSPSGRTGPGGALPQRTAGCPGGCLQSPGRSGAWQRTPSFLSGESQRMGEPGSLQFMGSQRVEHDWVTDTFTFFTNTCITFSLFIHHLTLKLFPCLGYCK